MIFHVKMEIRSNQVIEVSSSSSYQVLTMQEQIAWLGANSVP